MYIARMWGSSESTDWIRDWELKWNANKWWQNSFGHFWLERVLPIHLCTFKRELLNGGRSSILQDLDEDKRTKSSLKERYITLNISTLLLSIKTMHPLQSVHLDLISLIISLWIIWCIGRHETIVINIDLYSFVDTIQLIQIWIECITSTFPN